jgi:PAS domain S-box-containing protein
MIFQKGKKEKEILHSKVENLQERLTVATNFLEKISSGDFNAALPLLASQKEKNGDTFYTTLQQVSQRLSQYAREEAERKWVSDGMTQFMNVIGGSNRNKEDFYDILLKLIIQYTGANQGGIFLLNDQQPNDLFLELTACYAFGKKKHQEKRVPVGQGMLGQCFLEKETTFISQVPQYYTTITSGLGEATPSYLLLIPMKYNSDVMGVIELAYFKHPEKYKIEFAERIAENIASVTINLRNATRAQELFVESQEKARVLQEQEEELRQNMEELVATQEEMKRSQVELNRQTSLLKFIVDNIPFPIFVKDDHGKYTIVNVAESKLFNLPDREIIGKDDSHFVKDKQEWEIIRRSDEKVLRGDEPVELPLQYFTTNTGNSFIFKTTKIPFTNEVTGKKNILGVSIDLTEKLTLEKNLLNERRINGNNIVINIAGRQRMLSQKIGFYCETLIRGKHQHAGLLRDAIELHEHTMQVLRQGGMPMGIACDSPLEPLDEDLIPQMTKIVNVWEVYKQAAENILYFAAVDPNAERARSENEVNIGIIEDNGELLLALNNEFMLAYMEHNQTKLAEAF